MRFAEALAVNLSQNFADNVEPSAVYEKIMMDGEVGRGNWATLYNRLKVS